MYRGCGCAHHGDVPIIKDTHCVHVHGILYILYTTHYVCYAHGVHYHHTITTCMYRGSVCMYRACAHHYYALRNTITPTQRVCGWIPIH